MKYPEHAAITYNHKDGPKLVPWICPDCRESRWITPYQAVMLIGGNPCCIAHLSAGAAGHEKGLTWVRAFQAEVRKGAT